MNDASIYRQVMGDGFRDLDPVVQHFHSVEGALSYQGEVAVDGAESWLGRVVAWLGRLPAAAAHAPFMFSIDANREREVWTRHFARGRMRSILSTDGGNLVERLGPFRLRFSLEARGGRLRMQLLQVTALGIPCPRWLFPDVFAEEHGEDGKFNFDIRMTMPLAGRVVRYRGFLAVAIPAAMFRPGKIPTGSWTESPDG